MVTKARPRTPKRLEDPPTGNSIGPDDLDQYAHPTTPTNDYAQATSPSKQYSRPTTPSKQYSHSTTTPTNDYAQATSPSKQYSRPTTPSKQYSHSTTSSQQYSRPTTPSKQYSRPSTPSKMKYQSSKDERGSILLELIEGREFERVISIVEKRPEEAAKILSGSTAAHHSIMNQGNLALHEACKNQPTIELIDALINANEHAVKTKGQWGYLPLHFACASRATPEVVAKLIIAYPSATRCKDDHEGTLALHLAAKWGSSEEVIMALLTVHPKGSTVHDSKGKTPLDHAKQLSPSHIREPVVAALGRAPILVSVTKAAMSKLAHESDAKLREVVDVYRERMSQVKDKYEQDKMSAVSLEVKLRKELWEEKERANKLAEKASRLVEMLHEKDQELEEKDDVLRRIGELLPKSLRSPTRDERELREEREHRDENNERNENHETTKSTLREWVSSGPTDHTSNDAMISKRLEEQREPMGRSENPPTNPSPRSEAMATVREWISAERSRLSDEAEEDVRKTKQSKNPLQDKVESYRQAEAQRLARGGSSADPASTELHLSQRISKEDQGSSKETSLLSRSKSAPRMSMKRRDLTPRQSIEDRISRGGNIADQSTQGSSPRLQSPKPEDHHLNYQNHRPHSISVSTSSRRTPTSQSSSRHTPTSQSSSRHTPTSQSSSRRTPVSSSSRTPTNSTSVTPITQGGGGATSWQKRLTQRFSSKQSSTRPRETYSTPKTQSSAYSQKILEDDESLTMDSMPEWE